MRPVDIGTDAARALRVPGPGRVRAVFTRALYLQLPGGLVALSTTRAPRGPLHIRVAALPEVSTGCPVRVDATALRVGNGTYPLAAPRWSPGLPAAAALAAARAAARQWLPDQGPALELGTTEPARLPVGALEALRGNALLAFAALVGGRGPGLTPAGDDLLAGVLLVARALRSASPRLLLRCARRTPTNDVARAFLVCAARGRCIEPAHELLAGLADADRPAARAALDDLRGFGSSSGAALAHGIRTALLELPPSTADTYSRQADRIGNASIRAAPPRADAAVVAPRESVTATRAARERGTRR